MDGLGSLVGWFGHCTGYFGACGVLRANLAFPKQHVPGRSLVTLRVSTEWNAGNRKLLYHLFVLFERRVPIFDDQRKQNETPGHFRAV